LSSERIVVIGGGPAGMSSAASARRVNPNADIIVFEASNFVSYGACGIPYFLSNFVDNISKLVTYTPEQFERERRVKIFTKTKVEEINISSKTLRYVQDNGRESLVNFDKLILATGAKPFVPKLDGLNLEGIHTVRLLEDAVKLRNELSNSNKVVIVGAGYIGLELSESFKRIGKDVTVLELLPHPMPNIDQDMSFLIEEELRKNGVRLELNKKVVGFKGKNRVEKVLTEDSEYDADLVVIAVGVRPNVDLAKKIGVELGRSGAIKTNERMETNIKDVFAAGDNCEAHHIVLNQPQYVPLAHTANKMGYVAGANAAGGNEVFPGIVGSAVTKVFDLEIGRTGISEEEARKYGIETKSVLIKSKSRAGYYPGEKDLIVKLILRKNDNVIIGAQVIGQEGVWGRISLLSIAIANKFTPKQLIFSDLPYAPPFGPVWDPVIIASRVALR